MMTRRQCLRQLLNVAMVGILAFGSKDLPAQETTGTLTQSPTCPAEYLKNSPACKRAKAERKCPEQLGGKCLAKKK